MTKIEGRRLIDPLLAAVNLYIEKCGKFKNQGYFDYVKATALVGELQSSLNLLKDIIKEKLSAIEQLDTRTWADLAIEKIGGAATAQSEKENLIRVLYGLKSENLSNLIITKPASDNIAPAKETATPPSVITHIKENIPPPVPPRPKPTRTPRPEDNPSKKAKSEEPIASDSDQSPHQTISWKKSASTLTYPNDRGDAYTIHDVISRAQNWLKTQKEPLITKLTQTGISGFKARRELNTLNKFFEDLSTQISKAERELDKAVKEIKLHVILTTHKEKVEKYEQQLCTLLNEESWTAPNKQGEPAQNNDDKPKITK